jgi:hypothetical protein
MELSVSLKLCGIRKTQEKLSFFKNFVNLYQYNQKLLRILIIAASNPASWVWRTDFMPAGNNGIYKSVCFREGNSGEMPAYFTWEGR